MKNVNEIKPGDYIEGAQISGNVQRVTEKAICIRTGEATLGIARKWNKWIPKSMLQIIKSKDQELNGEYHNTVFTIYDLPSWIFKNK